MARWPREALLATQPPGRGWGVGNDAASETGCRSIGREMPRPRPGKRRLCLGYSPRTLGRALRPWARVRAHAILHRPGGSGWVWQPDRPRRGFVSPSRHPYGCPASRFECRRLDRGHAPLTRYWLPSKPGLTCPARPERRPFGSRRVARSVRLRRGGARVCVATNVEAVLRTGSCIRAQVSLSAHLSSGLTRRIAHRLRRDRLSCPRRRGKPVHRDPSSAVGPP